MNIVYDSRERVTALPEHCYFVFGSNLKGIHGKGAALTARALFGAELGVGSGYSNRSYAIPTKDRLLRTLSLEEIKPYIEEFVKETQKGDKLFFLTQVGCGLAGYKAKDIAPMFKGVDNCYIPDTWKEYI